MSIVVCFVCIVFGIFAICKPEKLWKLDHFLTVKDGEPTELYLKVARAFGVVLILCGIVYLILMMAGVAGL
ncbi:MAG: nickel ABC transporter permease [Lachnospiraceae bacterium]|nr:nickel ABC transporter permease [Lachnospiraceae bacterium]